MFLCGRRGRTLSKLIINKFNLPEETLYRVRVDKNNFKYKLSSWHTRQEYSWFFLMGLKYLNFMNK